MKTQTRLDLLESDVMSRIAAHRQAQKSLRSLPVAALVCAIALASGWVTGMAGSRQKAAGQAGSESALMSDDMRLAPSSLLANNQ